MPRNIEIRERVGGVFNHADSLLYPKTHINMVEGLLTDGKLSLSLLPEALKTGLKKVGSLLAGSKTLAELLTLMDAELATLGLSTDSRGGSYFYSSNTNTVSIAPGHVFYGADDGASSSTPVTLETNDWVMYDKFEPTTETHIWTIVNNTHGLVTTSANGLMTATDKTKLDGIATNANNYSHPTYTVRNVDTDGVVVLDTFTSDAQGHVTGIGTRSLPSATSSTPGIMSSIDKNKLDGIAENANNYSHPTQTAKSEDLTSVETIDSISFDTAGHIATLTKQAIRAGSTSQTGLLQLATGAELTTGLNSTKATTPIGVKTMIDYFAGMKRYADITAANAASHPDGAIALITVA